MDGAERLGGRGENSARRGEDDGDETEVGGGLPLLQRAGPRLLRGPRRPRRERREVRSPAARPT